MLSSIRTRNASSFRSAPCSAASPAAPLSALPPTTTREPSYDIFDRAGAAAAGGGGDDEEEEEEGDDDDDDDADQPEDEDEDARADRLLLGGAAACSCVLNMRRYRNLQTWNVKPAYVACACGIWLVLMCLSLHV